ncbi:hypothetical protein O3G_MSEX012604 [Manduca sexta]|uniref:ERAP1-like C-terminal domain-containing protein n=1 Tax=Manduca sexta TaxID=7130 RepID=A0A921ZPM2_MANSE|nr:hypothetical protein O3G_MSEX012604 [Manduca sexta]
MLYASFDFTRIPSSDPDRTIGPPAYHHTLKKHPDKLSTSSIFEVRNPRGRSCRRKLVINNICFRFLLLAWDERNIRSQDYLTVLHQISSNPSGTALVWDDVRTRWGELVHRFTLNSRYLGNLIPAITSSFNTELKLKEVLRLL